MTINRLSEKKCSWNYNAARVRLLVLVTMLHVDSSKLVRIQEIIILLQTVFDELRFRKFRHFATNRVKRNVTILLRR